MSIINSLLSFQGGITVPGFDAYKGRVKQLMLAFESEWVSKGGKCNCPCLHATEIPKHFVRMLKELNLF